MLGNHGTRNPQQNSMARTDRVDVLDDMDVATCLVIQYNLCVKRNYIGYNRKMELK